MKTITAIKEHRAIYTVDGECDDAAALKMVIARMNAGSPIGLQTEEEKLLYFDVADGDHHTKFDAEGQRVTVKAKKAQPPTS